MAKRTVGIIMNGVTGRMGSNQHLARSIMAIREQGGVHVPGEDPIWPEPVLVGRDERKLRRLAEEHGLDRFTTNLDEALDDPANEIYFDAQVTSHRAKSVLHAIQAGKHIYCEKPTAEDLASATELAEAAEAAGVCNGVVQDKLFLPGLLKLKRLVDGGFFGRILSIRGEFGYWVFEGDWQDAQRPSWNYRSEDGGGIIVDMFAHWQYVLEGIFAPVRTVTCLGATHIPQRVDERGQEYKATADDAAYAIFELEGGIVAQLNSSWTVRVFRDELVEFQVDGTEGSAVAGLRNCVAQHRSATPKPVWNPDLPVTQSFRDDWATVPDNASLDNGFKVQWEHFLRHVCHGEPFPWDLRSGAKGVQLSQLGLESWQQRRTLDIPPLPEGGR